MKEDMLVIPLGYKKQRMDKGCCYRVLVLSDECYLVLFHTPLFMFVRPLVLLIFNNLTCFVCFVINRPLHHVLIEGAKMDMK
jgi:hypothetical protein